MDAVGSTVLDSTAPAPYADPIVQVHLSRLKRLLKMLSFNEEQCMRRNRIEKNKHDNYVNMISREFKHQRNQMIERERSIERFEQSLNRTTGSTFQSDEAKLMELMDGKSSKSTRTYSEMRRKNESNRSTRFDFSDDYHQTESVLDFSTNSFKKQLLPPREPSVVPYQDEEERFFSQTLERFLDKDHMVKYKPTKVMKPIPSQSFAEIERLDRLYNRQYKDDVFNEYKYFGDSRNFEFKDEKKYKYYLKLCELRDSTIVVPKEKIKELKKRDPIFAKRYKEFLKFKDKYRAPQFDPEDHYRLPPIPRLFLERQKEMIVKEKDAQAAPKLPKVDMKPLFDKCQQFLNQFEAEHKEIVKVQSESKTGWEEYLKDF